MENLGMGDHGVYVWSAYAIALAVFWFIEWRARVRHREIYRDVEVKIKAVEERL